MSESRASPWRQPVFWLVLGMPAVMVVAGVMMVRTAVGVGSTDSRDPLVQRTAQMQTVDLSADLAASKAQLRGSLRQHAGALELVINGAAIDRTMPLVLRLQHPVDARADRRVILTAEADGVWRARLDLAHGHDWLLELAPESAAWRLKGRWLRQQDAAELRPAFSAAAR